MSLAKPSSLAQFALTLSAAAFLFAACRKESVLKTETLFTSISPEHSGIDFINQVKYTEELNCYTFRNFYNGGGVGLGDFNNDGLLDIFFCGNMVSNRLYLNRGNFQFEDITEQAGVGSKNVWSSGVSIADVNGDGWLDIYVCKSGPPGGEQRHNELFINGGQSAVDSPQSAVRSEQSAVGSEQSAVPTFTEKSKEYGLAEEGLSVHAAFFDYDLDGDLDCYLLNNSLRSVGGYDLIKDQRNVRDPQGGNKLFRNEGGASPKFTDVSEATGIYGSNVGFGLGVSVGDLNLDGAPDLFVSNDFFERDYLYLNSGESSESGERSERYFQEILEQSIRETSMGSMGADIADVNNDGLPDIFVTEMLPESDARMKTKTKFENWELYQREIENGYYHQFTRNTLQLNLGKLGGNFKLPPNLEQPHFTEISRLAGVHATDWSWGALILDMDNDGWKDIFVANGIGKDLTDQDYVNFYSDPEAVRAVIQNEKNAVTKLVDAMPSEKIPNYAFQNQLAVGSRQSPVTNHQSPVPNFSDKAKEWGLGEPSFSNGSAYGDLDNDGDLDLVVNNLDMPPFLYRNNADTLLKDQHFLNVRLIGDGMNTHAIGAKVTLRSGGRMFFQEVSPMRGFESTCDSRLHFGLGGLEKVDTLIAEFPGGAQLLLTNVPADQFLTLHQKDAAPQTPATPKGEQAQALLENVTARFSLPFRHVENEYSDFDREQLIYHILSAESPKMCSGDVNGDGLQDFFISGAKDSPGALFVQLARGGSPLGAGGGGFAKTNEVLFEKDKVSEDLGSLLFDADGDRDLDLYVASGGNEFSASSSALADRLYFNDGKGNFTKSNQLLPAGKFESTSCVSAADFDADGDQDLFVGVRLIPSYYGVPGSSYILQNDGKGNFKNATPAVAPALKNLGMVTDAKWFDADGDRDPDLAIVGEYLPLQIFLNDRGTLNPKSQIPNPKSSGWWNCLEVSDLDGDSDLDLIAGNHGLNSRFKASPEQPVTMVVNDFDHNGTAEHIVNVFAPANFGGGAGSPSGGGGGGEQRSFPLALRHDLVKQLPFLKKKYLYYKDYKNQSVDEIFTPEQLTGSVRLAAEQLQSCVFLNDGKGNFEMRPLPVEAQFAPVYAVLAEDFNGDGKKDLLLGGNFYRSKPEVGIYDGSYGWLLLGDGKGGFQAQLPRQSGFFVKGEIRDMISLPVKNKRLVLVARNNEAMEVFEF